jgi:hypothetical protein
LDYKCANPTAPALWIARMKRLKRTFLGTILLLLVLTFCGLIQSSLR